MNCVYLNFCALLFLWKFISSSTLPLVTTFLLHKSFSFSSLSHKSLFKNPSAPWKQSPREMMIRIEQFSCWRCQQLFAVVKISTFECYWKFMSKWNLRLIAFARARCKKNISTSMMMMRLSQLHIHKKNISLLLDF